MMQGIAKGAGLIIILIIVLSLRLDISSIRSFYAPINRAMQQST